jgi:hypothetical protein
MSRIGKSVQKESRFLIAKGWRIEENAVSTNAHGVYSGNSVNVLELGSGDLCTTLKNTLKITEVYILKGECYLIFLHQRNSFRLLK